MTCLPLPLVMKSPGHAPECFQGTPDPTGDLDRDQEPPSAQETLRLTPGTLCAVPCRPCLPEGTESSRNSLGSNLYAPEATMATPEFPENPGPVQMLSSQPLVSSASKSTPRDILNQTGSHLSASSYLVTWEKSWDHPGATGFSPETPDVAKHAQATPRPFRAIICTTAILVNRKNTQAPS